MASPPLWPYEESFRDPANNNTETQLQLSVDQARSQAHRLLHKCTAELRKLQTDRRYRDETFEAGANISDHGLADWRYIRKGIAEKFQADYQIKKLSGMAEIDAILSTSPSSFCKTGFSQPRPLQKAA